MLYEHLFFLVLRRYKTRYRPCHKFFMTRTLCAARQKGMDYSMSTLELILTILVIICSVFLIAVVLLQSGKRSGLSGSISGIADTFLSKGKAKTWDAILEKITIAVAVVFVLVVIAMNFIGYQAPATDDIADLPVVEGDVADPEAPPVEDEVENPDDGETPPEAPPAE